MASDDIEHAKQGLVEAALTWAFERRRVPAPEVGPEADLLAAIHVYRRIAGQISRQEIESLLQDADDLGAP